MVNRNYNFQQPEQPTSPVRDRSSINQNSKRTAASTDEVLMSLANRYENKRARQVSEWVRVQPANIRQFI